MDFDALIITDGSCLANGTKHSSSSAVALITCDNKNYTGVGTYIGEGTNQRAELMAAIIGLENIQKKSKILVITDSNYLISTMTKGWKRNCNNDLWDQLDRLCAGHFEVSFTWQKGHSGDHAVHTEVDRLACQISLLKKVQQVEIDKACEKLQGTRCPINNKIEKVKKWNFKQRKSLSQKVT